MKKIIFLILAATIGFSCSEENEYCDITPPAAGNGEIAISALIADVKPMLKTTMTGSTASWANGDAIGLFCPQTKTAAALNVKYTFASPSTWTASTPIYWADGITAHKFTAYAPYAIGSTNAAAIPLPSLTTQTGSISPTQDFLISNSLNTSGITRVANVGLTFTHAFSLIELQIKTDVGIVANSTLTDFILTGGAGNKLFTDDATSTIDLSSGTISATGATKNTITVTPGTPPTLSGTTTSLYVLLLPGTFTAPILQVDFKEGGTPVTGIPSASIGTTTFAAATKYTYVVTLSRTAISISTPTITDWTPGNGSGGSVNIGL